MKYWEVIDQKEVSVKSDGSFEYNGNEYTLADFYPALEGSPLRKAGWNVFRHRVVLGNPDIENQTMTAGTLLRKE